MYLIFDPPPPPLPRTRTWPSTDHVTLHPANRLSGKFVDGKFYEAGETEELCEKAKDAADKGDESAVKAAEL